MLPKIEIPRQPCSRREIRCCRRWYRTELRTGPTATAARLLRGERRDLVEEVAARVDAVDLPRVQRPGETPRELLDVVGGVGTADRVLHTGDPDAIDVVGVQHHEPECTAANLRVHLVDVPFHEGETIGAEPAGPDGTRGVQGVGLDGVVGPIELRREGIDPRRGLDADLVVHHPVPVVVQPVVVQLLVDPAGAVVVQPVVDLRGAGEHGVVAVIAVDAGHVSVPVAVRVRIAGGHRIAAVAVLVDGVVPRLRGAGVDRAGGVIAVGVVRDVARGGAVAGGDRAGAGTVPIAVTVGVVGGEEEVLVHHPVPVVVRAVADLDVVAIRDAVVVHVVAVVDEPVALVVDAVADLGGAGVHAGVGVVAVVGIAHPVLTVLAGPCGVGAVALAVHVPIVPVQVAVIVADAVVGIVHHLVAVVVRVVADLDGAGVALDVAVVAVGVVGGPPLLDAAGHGRRAGLVAVAVGVGVGVGRDVAAADAGVGVVAVRADARVVVDRDHARGHAVEHTHVHRVPIAVGRVDVRHVVRRDGETVAVAVVAVHRAALVDAGLDAAARHLGGGDAVEAVGRPDGGGAAGAEAGEEHEGSVDSGHG